MAVRQVVGAERRRGRVGRRRLGVERRRRRREHGVVVTEQVRVLVGAEARVARRGRGRRRGCRRVAGGERQRLGAAQRRQEGVEPVGDVHVHVHDLVVPI